MCCCAAGIEPVTLASISHEPTVADVDGATNRLRELDAGEGDFLLAVGGGSAIDLAKAAGAMATNRESETVKDFLEGVGRGLKINREPLPLAALPTTGGTGAEATKNAVISSHEPAFKKSLRSERMVPKLVLVDPELSVDVPPTTTAWTGMDAITQLIESYISRFARPIPQALAIDGLRLRIAGPGRGGARRIVAACERKHGPCGATLGHRVGEFRIGNGAWRGGRPGHCAARASRTGLRRHVADGSAREL